MICPTCHGLGRVTYDELPAAEKARVGFGSVFPCPTCTTTGGGIYHARRDGLTAANDVEERDDA